MTLQRPPYDPEIAAYLDAADDGMTGPLDLTEIDERRAGLALLVPPIESVIEGTGFEVVDFTAPGPSGSPDVVVSIIRKPGAGEPEPCIYNIHGGGMMTGTRFSWAEGLVELIKRFGVVVATVEYRLAPEHPHPAPVEDCYAGLVWLAAHAADVGVDPDRILLQGHSAGGGLAAAVALMARDRGGPALMGQVLGCPMLDDRDDTVSTRQYDNRTIWNRSANQVAWTALLGDRRGGPDVSPYAAPARATDLSGLPPAYIDVGSAEVFRDEAVDYATRIWAAGGQAELHVWAGGFHGYEMFDHSKVAQATGAARMSWMSRALGG